MWALAFWTAAALACAVGYRAPGPLLYVALLAAGLAGACACATARPGPLLAAGVVAVACVRGAGARADERGPRSPRDAAPGGLREFVVSGASTPGTSCRVLVRDLGAARPFELSLPAAACPLAEGARLAVEAGDLREGRPRWPGGWNAGEAARAAGADGALVATRCFLLRPSDEGPWLWVARMRQRFHELAYAREELGFVVAAVAGLRDALPPARRRELRDAGLAHLVAVSGSNVALAAWFVFPWALRLGLVLSGSVGLAVALSVMAVSAYVVGTGAEAAAVRSGLMIGCAWFGVLMGRGTHGLATLALVSALMLLWHPAWVTDPGFALSLAATAGLVTAPRGTGIAAQSWRLTLCVLPVTLLWFGAGTSVGVAANLVAVPVFAAWVLPAGLVGLTLEPVVGAWVLEPAGWGATLILDGAALAARLPGLAVGWVLTGALLPWVVLRVPWIAAREAWRGRLGPWQPPWPAWVASVLGWSLLPSPPAPGTVWIALRSGPPAVAVVDDDGVACVRDPIPGDVPWSDVLGREGVRRVLDGLRGVSCEVPAAQELLRRAGRCPRGAREGSIARVGPDGRLHCLGMPPPALPGGSAPATGAR
jgi:competence protein ComEC